MLDSARKREVAVPKIPAQFLLSAGTLASCGWLLMHNKVHPIIVYLLQVYLTF